MQQRWIFSIVAIFLLGTSVTAHANHPDPATEGQDAKPRPPKTTLGVGVTLDKNGRLWLARVENQRLLVSRSDDNGANFSSPVVVTPEPENISADGENRPKIAVARDGTVLLTWIQSLPQKYSGNVRFVRSTDSGQTFSRPITLNDDSRLTSHRFDSLVIDGTGRVVVAWLDARDRDAAKEKGEAFSGVSIYTAQSSDNGASFGTNHRFQQHLCECCRIGLTWTREGPVALWRNIFGTNTRDFAIANVDKGGIRRATDDEWQMMAAVSCIWSGLPMARLVKDYFTNVSTAAGNRSPCPSAILHPRQITLRWLRKAERSSSPGGSLMDAPILRS